MSSRGWVIKVVSALTVWLLLTAQGLPCGDPDSQHAAPRRELLDNAGEPGVWFRMDVARCLLEDVTELSESRFQVKLLEQQLKLRDEQKILLTEAIEFSDKAKESAIASLEASERWARKAEERANAWYRSPVLWFIVGTVVTTSAVVAASRYAR